MTCIPNVLCQPTLHATPYNKCIVPAYVTCHSLQQMYCASLRYLLLLTTNVLCQPTLHATPYNKCIVPAYATCYSLQQVYCASLRYMLLLTINLLYQPTLHATPYNKYIVPAYATCFKPITTRQKYKIEGRNTMTVRGSRN